MTKLRSGMYVMLRESSLRRGLKELIDITLEPEHSKKQDHAHSRPFFTLPLYEKGFLDHAIKLCLERGIDVNTCYRIVTLKPALYFSMEHRLGGIAPGRYADMVALDELDNPTSPMVIAKGRIATSN